MISGITDISLMKESSATMDISLISQIPNMNSILQHPRFESSERARVKHAAQSFLDELRAGILSGAVQEIPSPDECAKRVLDMIVVESALHLRGVINATGVVLHTNLGRAPLGDHILSEATDVFRGYSNLEYDLETGQRGSRYSHVEDIICELTGAEAAMVVNNNAAALFLALAALAKGKRVAVSRGELVEIGGSFRIPEIMENSGAELVEVGTTNKTRLRDYTEAADGRSAEILLKVHTSNYEIVGFTESVSVAELASFGRQRGLPVLYDMGSCFLIPPGLPGLSAGETAADAISSGADLICFSGDKLIGSAQAGIVAGKAEYIAAMRKFPLARMVRPDKLTLSVLEATLRMYKYPDEARRKIPAFAMLTEEPDMLKKRAEALALRIRQALSSRDDAVSDAAVSDAAVSDAATRDAAASDAAVSDAAARDAAVSDAAARGAAVSDAVAWDVSVCETEDEAGGGSLPNVQLPGWGVRLSPAPGCMSVSKLEQRLRSGSDPVIIRIHDGNAIISPRTLLPGDDDRLIEALRAAANEA